MEQAHEQIEAAGLRLQAIGLGEPKHARHFCGKLAPHITCHVDQDKKAYATYGLKQAGLKEMMNPAMVIASIHARHFCGKLAPHITCHVDQDKKAYATYGLKQAGLKEMMNPAMVIASMRAAASGHVQGEATGDTWMLPGTFVVDGDGIIQYAYYSHHAGDHPDINLLLKTLSRRDEEEE